MTSLLPLASVNRLFFMGPSPLGGSRSLKLPAARKRPGQAARVGEQTIYIGAETFARTCRRQAPSPLESENASVKRWLLSARWENEALREINRRKWRARG